MDFDFVKLTRPLGYVGTLIANEAETHVPQDSPLQLSIRINRHLAFASDACRSTIIHFMIGSRTNTDLGMGG